MNHQTTCSNLINSADMFQRSHIFHPNNIQNFNHSVENPVQNAPQNQLSRASHSAVNENVHYGMNNNARHDNNYPNEMRQTYPAYTGYYPYIPQTNAYPNLPPYNTPQNQFNNYPEVPYNNIDYSHNPINENNQQPVYNHVAGNYPNVGETLNPVHLGNYNPHPQQNFLQNTPHQSNFLPNPQVQNVNTYSANRRSRYHSSYLIPQPPGAVNAIRKVREWRLTFPTSGLDPEEFLFKLERKMIAEGLTSEVGLVILPKVLTGNALTWYACKLLTPPGILEQLSTIIDALPWKWILHLRTRPISTYNELYTTINQLEAVVKKRSAKKINKNESRGSRDSKSRNKLL